MPTSSSSILQTIPQSQEKTMNQPTTNAILVIGGAEDKVHGREILHTFWEKSGGTEAIIGIIPSASREPTLIGERYYRIFSNDRDMGAKELQVIDIRDRTQGDNAYYLEFIERCTGIFMTGGDQLRLCGLLADTPIMNRILERVHLGEISIAGTSAGAAVMGRNMIAGGGSGESPNRSLVDLATGFGIIDNVIIDQHFHQRNRTARLLSAIASHPQHLGIGIDEDTCAMFQRDGWIEIIGKGTASFIDTRSMTYTNQSQISSTDPLSLHNLKISILCHGDRYHLEKHEVIPSKSEK